MTQNKAPKIVCIGLDSVDKDLVIEWAKAGFLPNIASVFEKSTWGQVSCPAGVSAGSGWPTFNTGLLPGHHGQYFGYSRFDTNSYEDCVLLNESDIKWQMFWEIFGDMGRKSVVYDAPLYVRTDVGKFNGVILADWGTHDRPLSADFWTHPEYLAGQIKERFGLDKIGQCDDYPLETDEEFGEFVENLIERAQRKTAISLYLMDLMEEWDLFFVTFHEAHCVGHQCWHLHDPKHFRHDSALARKIGDPLLRVYSRLDSSIGEILSRVDGNAIVLILLNEGMGPHYTGTYFMDEILARVEHHTNRSLRVAQRQVLQHVLRPVWRMMPQRARENLRSLRRAGKSYLADREHRKYFEVKTSNQTAGIRLNVIGRERKGLIERGTEYDNVCIQLIEDLATFRNQDTGEELFADFIKTSEMYDGEFLDVLPDILANWNRTSPIRRATSPKFGTLENKTIHRRTGDHVPLGLFLAFGPTIEPRALNRVVSPTDFAPTFAYLLGLQQATFDGQVIPELTGS